MILQGHPLTDILVKYVFELRITCPNFWWKKVLPVNCHFNSRKSLLHISEHDVDFFVSFCAIFQLCLHQKHILYFGPSGCQTPPPPLQHVDMFSKSVIDSIFSFGLKTFSPHAVPPLSIILVVIPLNKYSIKAPSMNS